MASEQSRPRGRPPTPDVEEKSLAATRAMIHDVGYEATSIEAIAQAAGVTKAAIYRRWPNKARLVYDAVFVGNPAENTVQDTGDIRTDLLTVLRQNAAPMRDRATNALLNRLVAEAAKDPSLAASLRSDLFQPRVRSIADRVRDSIVRGELADTVDADLVPALLTGPLQYLLIVHGSTLPDSDLERIVDAVIGPHVLPRPRR